MRDKHYAYLAAAIDGDGCFMAYIAHWKQQVWYRVHLSVNSVETKLPKVLVNWFGGSYKPRERSHYNNGRIYEWKMIAKQNVRSTIEGMLPFLVLKKQQALLALQFLDLPRGCPEERERIVREIQALNQLETSSGSLDDFGKMKWPYLAGLMDTEGTFAVRKDFRENYVHYGIWARLANTNRHVMDWLDKNFGAATIEDSNALYWPLPYDRKGKEQFLLNLLPYLTTKKEQAKILLEYIRLGDQRCPEKREELFQKCFALNHPPLEVTTVCD